MVGEKAKAIVHYYVENMLNKIEVVILRLRLQVRSGTLKLFGNWRVEQV